MPNLPFRTLIVIFLVFLFSGLKGATPSQEFSEQIDSIQRLLPTSPDSIRILHLKSLARLFFEMQDSVQMQLHLQKLHTLASEMRSDRAMADALHSFSDIYLDLGRFEEALVCAARMLKHAQKSRYPKRISQAYNHMGLAHRYLGNFSTARSHYLDAAKVNEQFGLSFDEGLGYNNIARLSTDLGMYEEAFVYFEKLDQIVAGMEDEFQKRWLRVLSLYGRALVHLLKKEFDEAIYIYQTAIDLIAEFDNPVMEFTRIQSLSRMARCHFELGNREAAEGLLWKVLEEESFPWKNIIIAEAKGCLAEIHLQNGNQTLAEQLGMEAKQLAEEIDFKEVIVSSHEVLTAIYTDQGAYEQALQAQQVAMEYKDLLFNEEKLKAFAGLETKFKIRQKEQTITNLRQKNQIQQLWLWIILTGTAITMVMTFLLWRLSRIRKTKNHEIESQRKIIEKTLWEKEQLLKDKDQLLDEKDLLMSEIHHRVKNNLLILETLLKSQSSKVKDHEAITLMHKNRSRLESIRIIHQQLFQSRQTSKVEVIDFLDTMIHNLRNAFPPQITLEFAKTNDLILIDVQKAVALGLLANEIITNAVKYAFPRQWRGIIRIAISCENDHCILKIRDNGVGFPQNERKNSSSSSGLALIEGLTRQIGGKLSFSSDSTGTRFTIFFTAETRPFKPRPLATPCTTN